MIPTIAFTVVEPADGFAIIGTVPCGPIEPMFDWAQGIRLTDWLSDHPDMSFNLRVRGCSMEGAGIEDEDVITIDAKIGYRDGDILLVYLDGHGFTVKRWRLGRLWAELVGGSRIAYEIEDIDTIVRGVVTAISRRIRW